MNNKNQLVSSISMLLILFFIVARQVFRFSNIDFIRSTTLSSDLLFVMVSSLLVVAIAIAVFYIPMLFILKFNIKFKVYLSPTISYIEDTLHFKIVFISSDNRRYQTLNVIRC